MPGRPLAEASRPLASRLENDATLRAFAERARQARKDGREGRGVGAVFFGKKGSGRTTAARALAHELGLALHRVDLERVVSQYIGETEKNVEQLFAAAEAAGAILSFDEADSLFGKRSEMKDSHDRLAPVLGSGVKSPSSSRCFQSCWEDRHFG